ncbi:MAG: mycofactocin-coupled SDR family oxidoreductase [Acidimicrobiales bacterium]
MTLSDGHDGGDSRVAVITGGARGIGAATGLRLARQGWKVALIDAADGSETLGYGLATAADLERSVVACGEAAIGLMADVRDQDALDRAVTEAAERLGGVDAAVAAAGAIAGGPDTWHTSDAIWDAMIGINLTGVFHLARSVVPHLLDRPEPRSGRFVAVASAASVDGLPRLSAYTAAKAGVAGLVRALAAELGPLGITANAVAPGSTRTAMIDASAAVYDLGSPDEFVVHQPIGRLLEADEIAAAIAWLCSHDASAITGAVVPVDGGMTAT